MQKRILEDKLSNVGAVAFGLALLAWYAGGSGSIGRMIDVAPLLWASSAVGVLAALVGFAIQHRVGSKALGNAAFFGVAFMFAATMLGALCNRFADRSEPQSTPGVVLAFREQTKGPDQVTLESQGERTSFDADIAEGCAIGDEVSIERSQGALGMPWVSALRCKRPSADVPDHADLIRIEAPPHDAVIRSPLRVAGKARGSWYFEATFPVKLLDANGQQVTQSFGQASGEWMTSEFVPFEGKLIFERPATPTGTLVFEKANASGLPEHDDALRVPVRFESVPPRLDR